MMTYKKMKIGILPNNKLDEFRNAFARLMVERGVQKQMPDEALKTQTCCKCGKSATEFKDEVSVQEYRKLGWCQQCQDEFFA